MSLRALVVEDEPLARERLRTLLSLDPGVAVVGEADNARAALLLLEQLRPDLLFLDIEMPEETGLGLLQRLDPAQRPVVVFTTAHPEYAVDAFDVNAADYLVKPIDAEHVSRSLDRARRLIAGGRVAPRGRGAHPRERFAVRTRGEIVFIKAAQIDWISAEGNYSRLHSGEQSYLMRESLQSIESSLDPSTFIRVHRSAIVNLDRVRKLATSPDGNSSIVLSTGDAVPLGPSYRGRLEEIFGQKL